MRSFMIRMINSWRMSSAAHVAHMEKKINAYRFLVGNTEGTTEKT
jgi:hypothetical protein